VKNKNILLGLLLLIIAALLIWYFGFRSTDLAGKTPETITTEQPSVTSEQKGPTSSINTITGADGKKQDITTLFTARDSAVLLPGGINTLPSLQVVDHETDVDQLYFQLPMAKFNNYTITFVMDKSKTINAAIREENSSRPGIMTVSNSAEILESLKQAKNIEVIVDIQSIGKKSLYFVGASH
jgi:hypothetical protein